MLHAYTSTTDIYWRIPNTNWRAHLEQCHRNPNTLKGPGAMLNQPVIHLTYGEVHTSASWITARTVESSDHREKPFPPLRQTMTFLPIYLFWVTNCLSLVRTTLRFFFTNYDSGMKKDKEIEPIFASPYFYHKTKSSKTPP